MKIALIVIGVIAVAGIAIEVVGKMVARRAKARFYAMSPDGQRKEQEKAYKAQAYGSRVQPLATRLQLLAQAGSEENASRTMW